MRIHIYQNYHSSDLIKYLDPAFIPHDNTQNENPAYREYWLFLTKIYQKKLHKNADYTGLLSWKFNEKTKITGDTFINFIKDNPGFDVYFINPLPFTINSYAFENVWIQGDYYHPGLLDFVQGIMDKLNYNIALKSLINDESTTLFCNYWVGNEKFWTEYIKFTKPVYDYLTQSITPDEKRFISQTADKIININYTPFIFERLFSTLLAVKKAIKSLNYQYSRNDLEMLPNEDKAAIMLFRNIKNGFELFDKEMTIGHLRTLVQQILGDRHKSLEANEDISVRISRKISDILHRYPMIKKLLMFSVKKRWIVTISF